MSRIALRSIALFYLAALLVIPVGMVFYRAFEKGFGTAWDAVTTRPPSTRSSSPSRSR